MIRPCRSTVASRSAAQSSAVTGKAVPKSRSGPRTSPGLLVAGDRMRRCWPPWRSRPTPPTIAILRTSTRERTVSTALRPNGCWRSGWSVDAGSRTPSSDGEKRISASRRRSLETTRRRTALNLAPMTSRQDRARRSDLEPRCGPNAGIEPCSSRSRMATSGIIPHII